MPKNSKGAGTKQAPMVLTSHGTWVRNKFAGMRTRKNTSVWDYRFLNTQRTLKNKGTKAERRTHTSPVVRTPENDGHDNPTRLRHAATKRMHTLRKMDSVVEETSFTG